MDTLIELKGLKKHYPVEKGFLFTRVTGWVKAVDDISISFHAAQTHGILGESGCGKTTLSRLLLLLERPTTGVIEFEGVPIVIEDKTLVNRYRQNVQAVFQNPLSSLNPRMRVGSIIREPITVGTSAAKSDVRSRVADVLESVGLSAADAAKFPHEFSGGQRQRIAIARALISNPKLIVLDEPVSSQDVSIRAQLMNILKDLQDELGVSYMFIAHDLATVKYMSHRISVMYLGKVVESAPCGDLCRRPQHPYTQALFAASLPDNPDSGGIRVMLTGEVPSPIDPPSGCSFHTRCGSAVDACSRQTPTLREVAPRHFVACLSNAD